MEINFDLTIGNRLLRIKIILLSLLVTAVTFSCAWGQKENNQISLLRSVTLESLDGKNDEIVIFNDWMNRQIVISHLSDSTFRKDSLLAYCFDDSVLVFDNFYGEVEFRLLNKNFLEILYSAHGGSGYHLKHMILICTDKGRLFTSLFTTAESNYIYGEDANLDIYQLRPFLYKKNGDFVLKMKSRLWIKSKLKTSKEYVFKFDRQQKIFYSEQKRIKSDCTIHSLAEYKNSDTHLAVDGFIYLLRIGDPASISIDNNWYTYASDPKAANPHEFYQQTMHCKKSINSEK
jgi:hypothetical protein